MAIFGMGAFYEEDVTDSFWLNGVACIGWSYEDAPTLHRLMRRIKIGDIIYLKSHPPSEGLIIKAIGLVLNDEAYPIQGVGEACLAMRWIWRGYEVIGTVDDKYNVRNNTIYEELNPNIHLGLLLTRLNS